MIKCMVISYYSNLNNIIYLLLCFNLTAFSKINWPLFRLKKLSKVLDKARRDKNANMNKTLESFRTGWSFLQLWRYNGQNWSSQFKYFILSKMYITEINVCNIQLVIFVFLTSICLIKSFWEKGKSRWTVYFLYYLTVKIAVWVLQVIKNQAKLKRFTLLRLWKWLVYKI